ncbi:hypothetical protein ACOZ4Y_02380 [Komagataeibacter rhaeticus]
MNGLDLTQFKLGIVAPALDMIGLGGAAAINLLTGTALAESGLTYVQQNGGGPALGLWQMEPCTARRHLVYLPVRQQAEQPGPCRAVQPEQLAAGCAAGRG